MADLEKMVVDLQLEKEDLSEEVIRLKEQEREDERQITVLGTKVS